MKHQLLNPLNCVELGEPTATQMPQNSLRPSTSTANQPMLSHTPLSDTMKTSQWSLHTVYITFVKMDPSLHGICVHSNYWLFTKGFQSRPLCFLCVVILCNLCEVASPSGKTEGALRIGVRDQKKAPRWKHLETHELCISSLIRPHDPIRLVSSLFTLPQGVRTPAVRSPYSPI